MDAYTKNIMVANLVREHCDEQTGTVMDIAFDHRELYRRGLRHFYNCKLDDNMVQAMKYAHDVYNYNVYRIVKKVDVYSNAEVISMLPNVNHVTARYWDVLKHLIPNKQYELVEVSTNHVTRSMDLSHLTIANIKWFIHVEDFEIAPDFEHEDIKIQNIISTAENLLKLFPKADILSSTIPEQRILDLSRPLRAFIFVKEYMGCDNFLEPNCPVKLYVINYKMLPKLKVRDELEILIIYEIKDSDVNEIYRHLSKFKNLKHLVLIIDRPMIFPANDENQLFNVYISIHKCFYAVYGHMRLRVDINQYIGHVPKYVTLMGIENHHVSPFLYISRMIYHFLK